ncbi:MAG: hypothetical protein KME13_19830 [Myxacorys californica WJT36-NPBG1]|jgi:hypothetical protein|nr:hypothetical protein [Myxacorys californica WJT36-NPBG1]
MKILKQTTTELVTQHHQTGERLAIACCLIIGAGSILIATTVPEISCHRDGELSQCQLTRHMVGNWQIEQSIVIQSVRSEPICGFRRGSQGANCSYTDSVAIVKTQSGEIQLMSRSSKADESATAKIQRFINDPTQTTLQIRSFGWSLNRPIGNGFLVVLSIVMLISACKRFISKRIYRCEFNKTENWVRVTQKQLLVCRTTKFPISEIESINVRQKQGRDCIMLNLKSSQGICIAEAVWGKRAIEDHPLAGPVWVNKDLEKDMQAIVSFLRV